MPACAAQPACSRLVHAPSARYSMMPPAIEPALPNASTSWRGEICNAAPTPAAASTARPAHRAEHGGGMESGFVGECRRHERQPAHGLDADGEAEQRGIAV